MSLPFSLPWNLKGLFKKKKKGGGQVGEGKEHNYAYY